MKCEQFMNECIKVERRERFPLKMFFHILHCKNCRDNLRLITGATHFYNDKIMRRASKHSMVYLETMQSICAKENIGVSKKKPSKRSVFSFLVFFMWCFIGMLSLFTYVFLPSTNFGMPCVEVFGSYFKLQFFVMLALFCTIYTIIFIARNLDFISKTLKLSK